MMDLIYNILVVPAGITLFYVFSFFDPKLRATFKIREGLFEDIERRVKELGEGKKRVLVHISSVGEYLQALPVIRILSEERADSNVILSFFSPSVASLVERGGPYKFSFPLPFDTKRNMKKLLNILDPSLIIFSCYDVWANLVFEAKRRNIKLLLINASLPGNSLRIRPYIKWWFKMLYSELDFILASSESDRERFLSLGISEDKIKVSGNSRFEETLRRIETIDPNEKLLESLFKWKKGFIFIVGSSWEEDEREILPAYLELKKKFKSFKLILAPHEPSEKNIERVMNFFLKNKIKLKFLSDFEKEPSDLDFDVLLVDRIGVLYKLYKVADVAFVGGSFKREVHNVMEPAGFGIPVLFGPRFHNSREAEMLLERKAALSIRNGLELKEVLLRLFENSEERLKMGERAKAFIIANSNASRKTFEFLSKFF